MELKEITAEEAAQGPSGEQAPIIEGAASEEVIQEPAIAEGVEKPAEIATEEAKPEAVKSEEEIAALKLTEEAHALISSDLEARLFQETDGRVKDVDGLLLEYKQLQEAVAKKPTINRAILKEVSDKLQAEKGFNLQTALFWQNLDVSSLSDDKKVAWTLQVENNDRSPEWIAHEVAKFDKLKLSEEEVTEAIDNNEFTKKEYDEARVAFADLAHRSEKSLEKHKERYEINANFDPQQAPQQGLSEEQLAKEKASFASALKGFDKEEVEIDLPMGLGKETISVKIDDQYKQSIIADFDPANFPKEYKSESGIDYARFVRDMTRTKNFDKIVKRMLENSAAGIIKAYEKSRDNIQDAPKGKPAPPTTGKQGLFQGLSDGLIDKFSR